MDRKKRAFDRLWGPLGVDQKLSSTKPRFAQVLEGLIEGDLEQRADSISTWTFGEHVEHSYLVAHWVIDRWHESMQSSRDDQGVNVVGKAYFVGGWTPRGVYPTLEELVAKSGTKEDILPLKDSMEARLSELHWTWREIDQHPGRSYHPWMTWLTTKQWVFFLDAHNRHHQRILRDISRYSKESPGLGRQLAQALKRGRNEVMKSALGTRRPTPVIGERGVAVRAGWLAAAQE